MVTITLTLPSREEPDWVAAAHAIRGVPLANLWDTGDDLYPWEEWLGDVDNLPGAESAFVALRAAQAALHLAGCAVRGALDHSSDEAIAGSSKSHRFWVAGGPSWGEYPGPLVEPAVFLAEAGVLTAAGFDHFTEHAAIPRQRRKLRFDKDGLRRVRFGVVAAHAAEQAQLSPPALSEKTIRDWYEAWISDLSSAENSGDALGALFRFVAQGIQVVAWLKDPRGAPTAAALDACALELAQSADDPGVDHHPVRRSAAVAVRAALSSTDGYRDLVEAMSDPVLREAPGLVDYLTNDFGGTLSEALETEIHVGTLTDALAALADLSGENSHTLIERPPTPLESCKPRRRAQTTQPLEDVLSLVLVGAISWHAGEHAAANLDADAGAERQRDLADLRKAIVEGPYDRFTTSDEVGNERLLIAAPHTADGSDLAGALGRLARKGILDALGATWWSVPSATRADRAPGASRQKSEAGPSRDTQGSRRRPYPRTAP